MLREFVEMADSILNPNVIKGIPAGRFGEPDDMAALILFMASKAGSYHNGAIQVIDGGRLSLFPSVW